MFARISRFVNDAPCSFTMTNRARPGVSSLGLFIALYLIVLGSTYAFLAIPNAGPGLKETWGVLYIFMGVWLLWAATDALGPLSRRAAYGSGGTLLMATAIDLLQRGSFGGGSGHVVASVVVWYASVRQSPPDETRGTSLLGAALGAMNTCVGLDGVIRGDVNPQLPQLGVHGALVGWMYVLTGAAVVLVSIRRPVNRNLRHAAHALAGLTMAIQLVLIARTGALVISTLAAGLFRTFVTAIVPRWESVVSSLPSQALRVRLVVISVTMAALAGLMPMVAMLVLPVTEPAVNSVEWPRVLSFWAFFATIGFASLAGTILSTRVEQALRSALAVDTDRPRTDPVVEELDEVAGAVHGHLTQISRLQRDLLERDDRFGAVSHDLRNPLSGIINAAALLKQRADSVAMVRRAAGIIDTNARHMHQLVENLVEAARLESHQSVSVGRDGVSIASWLESMRDTFVIPGDGPRLTFSGTAGIIIPNPETVRRIVTNLVDNALKYSPAHCAVQVQVAAAGEEVVISVVDHGPGIRPEERHHIFDRYYRSKTQAGDREGVGLGLYIVHGLVERHGYRLWISDTPGGGATFHVAIPAVAPAQKAG